jgi:hypothetical protein
MAIAYKILGQSAPANTSNADLITVSSGQSEIVSSLVITNTDANAATAQVYARIAGAAAATSNAIIYEAQIAGYSTVAYTLGLTLAATDVLTVRTNVANYLTFTAFGSEIS